MRIMNEGKPYRVRVLPYRLVGGEKEFSSEGWIRGFDTAACAAEYMRKAQRLANHDVAATKPDGNGGRAWVTRVGLLSIVRKDNG